MASEQFVPVSGDDWYQRRRQDAEGRFFVKVANQGPRKGDGGNTRQGIYCLTADGELLAFKNAGNLSDVTREQLQQALAKFKTLPADRRSPGAIEIESIGKTNNRVLPIKVLSSVVKYTRIDSGLFAWQLK